MRRAVVAFIASWLLLVVLGIATSTQFVLARLSGLGVDISLLTRLQTTGQDIINMAPLYGIIFGGGFLGAVVAAALVARIISLPRGLIFAAAGATAMLVTLIALRMTFEITALAATREPLGVFAQCVVGALAGLIYARAAQESE